ncbi:Septum site-determining protein MinC [Candidatus Profftia lariciata]|uniref:septum site-determining protein MinC n=1 Tax=Candidatus Profftia lariciata TaxID=1987921 RepID=UPI001D02946C|nr:septum site-determining protein MinC [Candidatus Profftia lariciata]UDG81692.1 Septum site-determining protein MinC [Candidatus Profftia lariciata]
MSRSPIELKGSIFTFAVVHLYTLQPEVIYEALIKKITQSPTFLKNAPVIINLANIPEGANWNKIYHAINKSGLHIIGVSDCKDIYLKSAIINTGLPLLSQGKNIKQKASFIAQEPYQKIKTRVINTPIRSGQQIYAKDCDLIITSSVSAGAEVIADGNIHIYGMMRGRVFAGAKGDISSQIFCLYLIAELVSIAGYYWLSNQIPEKFYGQSARIIFSNNTLKIQPLL